MKTDLQTKEERLHHILAGFDQVAVAFSGGVDSSYLLAASVDVLGVASVRALTADSPLLPRDELETARQVARSLGVRHEVITFDELSIPDITANTRQRCYYCKRFRFEAILGLLQETGGASLLHGENVDDALDYRPGARAARELGVRAPLAEAALTKADIRELSKRRGLATWNLPSAACLASRFPYDVPLTLEGLQRVERAEAALRQIVDIHQLRIRDHYPVARIEVRAEDIERLAEPAVRQRIVQALQSAGYHYVALDLEGYRTGSMNDRVDQSASQ